MTERDSLISSSAFMALGTIISRITGFFRGMLIIAALGIGLNADVFTGANTVPNALYILVAGGIFNIILVPALVRAMENDADGGEAFGQRILTIGLVVLFVSTAVLMISIPWLMHLAFDDSIFDPQLKAARESAQFLMLLCMPQVFFYGAFVLVGQILNSRRRFGPMMWAPIANNLLAIVMLVAYLFLFGYNTGEVGFSNGEELLLGLGSTAGIALQFAILVPILLRTGFKFKLRFDWRGTGLRKTAVFGAWAFAFVLINQVAFFVIQRIGTGATAQAALESSSGAGATVYQFAYLVSQVPHGIITVSVMTAAMPALSSFANSLNYPEMRTLMDDTMRLVLVAVVPIALLGGVLAPQFINLTVSYGGAAGEQSLLETTVIAFAPAVVFSTMHYMMLRGFYALEDTKTPFYLQIFLVAINIGLAFALTPLVAPRYVAAVLAGIFTLTYAIGTVAAIAILSKRIGRIVDKDTAVFLVKLTIITAITGVLGWLITVFFPGAEGRLRDALTAVAVLSASVVVYFALARVWGIQELEQMLRVIKKRKRV